MTSQNILRNLLNENRKRRMLVVVPGLYFILMAAFQAAVTFQDSGSGSGDPRELFFGSISSGIIWVSVLFAVVCAVHGFSFLFSRAKADFYYSLPVTKRDVFLSVYLNGIIIYIIPCFLYHVILAVYGYASGFIRYSGTFQYMMISFLLMAAGYLLIYHMVIAVVMICGNLPVAAGLTVLILGLGKSISMLTNKYSELFFSTYYNSEASDSVLKYISPVRMFQEIMWTNQAGESSDWTIISVLPETGAVLSGLLLAGILAYVLYVKHPAEGAGQAVVFRMGQRLVTVVLVILSALLGGLALISLSPDGKSLVMMAAGIVIAAALVHGMLQMIYYGEMKAFFRGKAELIGLCAVSLFVAFGFRADLTGYDNFIGQPDKIKSMAVSVKGLSDLYAGTEPEQPEKSDLMAAARFSNMELTKDTKKAACKWIEGLEKSRPEDGDTYSYASVLYRMKSGRKIYRRYYIPSQKVLLKFADVFESEEYQEGEWPILRDGFAMQKEVVWSNGAETFTLNLSDGEKEEFLEMYQKELTAIQMKEITKEAPIGTITLSYDSSTPGNFSFLYGTFENTIAYLKGKGIPADKKLMDYEAVEIAVRKKSAQGSYGGRSKIYDDPGENAKMLQSLIFEDYNINPLLYPVNQENVIDVKIKSSAGDTITEVRCVEKQ